MSKCIQAVTEWLEHSKRLVLDDFLKRNVDNLTISQLQKGYSNEIQRSVEQQCTNHFRPLLAAIIDNAFELRNRQERIKVVCDIDASEAEWLRVQGLPYGELIDELCDRLNAQDITLSTSINVSKTMESVQCNGLAARVEVSLCYIDLIFVYIFGPICRVVARLFCVDPKELELTTLNNQYRPVDTIVTFKPKTFTIGILPIMADNYVDEFRRFRAAGTNVVIAANQVPMNRTRRKIKGDSMRAGLTFSMFGYDLSGSDEVAHYKVRIGDAIRYDKTD